MSVDHVLSVQLEQFAALIRLPTQIARPLLPLATARFHLQRIHESDVPLYWNVMAESLLARGAEVTGGPLHTQAVSLGRINYLVVLGEVSFGSVDHEAWRIIGIPKLVEIVNSADWQSLLSALTVTLPARGIVLERYSPGKGRMLKRAAVELELLLSRVDQPACYADLLAVARKSIPKGERFRRETTSQRGIGKSPAKLQGKIKFRRIRTRKATREAEARAGPSHGRSASPMDLDEPLAEQGPVVDGREFSPMEVDEDWEYDEEWKPEEPEEPEEFRKLLESCLHRFAGLAINRKRKAEGYPYSVPASRRRCVEMIEEGDCGA